MIKEIHEHKVDLSRLPDKAKILDIGARGFLFTNHFRDLGHDVIAVDIDDFEGKYERCAIMGHTGLVGIETFKDPQATRTCPGKDIKCFTLHDFSELAQVEMWDLIKIDVEGAELEIINSLKKAPAKQLSIEFHLHTGIYGEYEIGFMVRKLQSLGYSIASHELTSQHGAGFNYWSSLFILE